MSKKEKVVESKEKEQTQQQSQDFASAKTSETAILQEHDAAQEETVDSVTPEEARIAELEAEVSRLAKEMAEEREKFTRKLADMDNYRKRLIRDKELAVQYANERLLNDLIPILDDFDRAILSGESNEEVAAHTEGVKLIQTHLLEMLDRNWGLKLMKDLVGGEFSPHEHEALMMEEGDQYKVDTVLAELQKGYYLHDRVLRTAKVKVGKHS